MKEAKVAKANAAKTKAAKVNAKAAKAKVAKVAKVKDAKAKVVTAVKVKEAKAAKAKVAKVAKVKEAEAAEAAKVIGVRPPVLSFQLIVLQPPRTKCKQDILVHLSWPLMLLIDPWEDTEADLDRKAKRSRNANIGPNVSLFFFEFFAESN